MWVTQNNTEHRANEETFMMLGEQLLMTAQIPHAKNIFILMSSVKHTAF